MPHSFDFGIHLDLASGGGTPHGLAAGYNPLKRGTARDHAQHCLRVARQLDAPLVYLDAGKFHGAGQPGGHFHADGLLRMARAGVPYAIEFADAFAPLFAEFPTLVYTGLCGALWPEVYAMFRGAAYIAQDWSGTSKGADRDHLFAANGSIPTLCEGPANMDADGDALLKLGAVMTTQSWGWGIQRITAHDGLKVCLANNPMMGEWVDLDYCGLPFESDGSRPGWGANWAAWCRTQGVVPVLPVYGARGLVDVRPFRTALAPA